jgi:hypothetical protein
MLEQVLAALLVQLVVLAAEAIVRLVRTQTVAGVAPTS